MQRSRRRQGRARRLRADRIPRGACCCGKAVSPVALFPQYRDVQELAGGDRIHPADLWACDWRWVEPRRRRRAAAGLRPGRALALDQAVLRIVKTADAAAARDLAAVLPGPGRGAGRARSRKSSGSSAPASSRRWRSACCRPTSTSSAPPRACCCSTPRWPRATPACPTASRRTCCSSARRPCRAQAADAPALAARARGLRPRAVQAGRLQPAAVRPLRPGAADAGAQAHRRRQGNLVGAVRAATPPSSRRWPSSSTLVGDSLHQAASAQRAAGARRSAPAVDAVVRSGQPPRTELAMEVATAVLYLEAAFEDLDPTDAPAGRAHRAPGRTPRPACARAARPSRSSPGWRSCTAASATARPWAAWSANCAAR